MLGKGHLVTAIKEMQLISENFQTEKTQEVMLSRGHVMPLWQGDVGCIDSVLLSASKLGSLVSV